jgi:SRSO17 transposase
MQWLLNGATWDAEELRGRLRDYVVAHLGQASATLVLDDTLAYASAAGHAFLDRRLYLPESWTDDRERCRAAGVPDEVGFATKAGHERRLCEPAW